MRKTKIICTLGPATDKAGVLRSLMQEGMNVARFNFSHGSHEEHLTRLSSLEKLRNELSLPIATLLDTKGPEVRIGVFQDGAITLQKGQTFTLTTREVLGNSECVSVNYPNLPNEVSASTQILISDGLVDMEVKSVQGADIICEVQNGGNLSNHKSVNIPGAELSMPYISEKDMDDILFAIEHDFDYIAASFARSEKDILELKQILRDNGGEDIQVIAKIENMQGVENSEKILEVSDGIMIARGDLGVEVDFEDIPAIQKRLIKMTRTHGKNVITATQMLESMTTNPRPTRAETSDVANAVYDGTSAIMLSGETAVGQHPVEALKTMSRIAETTERNINYKKRLESSYVETEKNVVDAISHATCTTAHDLDAAAIIAVTSSGHTALMVSRFRPSCKIIAPTPNAKVYRQLAMSWGITPMMFPKQKTTDDLLATAIRCALEANQIKTGDSIVITFGYPLGVPGKTNVIKVHQVTEVD